MKKDFDGWNSKKKATDAAREVVGAHKKVVSFVLKEKDEDPQSGSSRRPKP